MRRHGNHLIMLLSMPLNPDIETTIQSSDVEWMAKAKKIIIFYILMELS